ncbi:hypothetical protein [Pleionea sp. CnH1-48]|uniref:hypothetical protein n=1 Tax=Pleionea sp. CnH1-48 TaxID=2954494 RepID=UPI002097D2BF|nr:hypothetical protein [Pleionea sp. CnH1-48]MCO7226945.1 hypothetical protein [Pleionea sp. CnH1-48]
MKNKLASVLISSLLAMGTGSASADAKFQNDSFDKFSATASSKTNIGLRCFVGPIGRLTNQCYGSGSALKSTATFKIDTSLSNFQVVWSNRDCPENSLTCTLPIQSNQKILLRAKVIDLDSNNYYTAPFARAFYESTSF